MPKQKAVISKIFYWPAAVLGLHLIATFTGAYWQWLKLDNLMHFLGGASVGAASMAFFAVAYRFGWLGKTKPLLLIFFAVTLTAFAAVCWEFMEYTLDYTLGINMQPDLTDTMSDLALGLTGGLLAAALKTVFKPKP